MNTRFGDAVRRARRAKGIKQEELAAIIGMERSYLSKIESGKVRNPEVETQERIAAGLQLTPNELFAFVGTSVMEERVGHLTDVEADELVSLYNVLTDDDRERLIVIARALYQLSRE